MVTEVGGDGYIVYVFPSRIVPDDKQQDVLGLDKDATTMVVIGHYLAANAFERLFSGELGQK